MKILKNSTYDQLIEDRDTAKRNYEEETELRKDFQYRHSLLKSELHDVHANHVLDLSTRTVILGKRGAGKTYLMKLLIQSQRDIFFIDQYIFFESEWKKEVESGKFPSMKCYNYKDFDKIPFTRNAFVIIDNADLIFQSHDLSDKFKMAQNEFNLNYVIALTDGRKIERKLDLLNVKTILGLGKISDFFDNFEEERSVFITALNLTRKDMFNSDEEPAISSTQELII